jgi:hypothetical protein
MDITSDTVVGQEGVLWTILYLFVLCIFLGYSLLVFWPAPALTVSAVQPGEMHLGDQLTVTVGGSGFANGAVVYFDDALGAVAQITPTSITVKPPPKHLSGEAEVIIKNPDGEEVAIPNAFGFLDQVMSASNGSNASASPVTTDRAVAPAQGPPPADKQKATTGAGTRQATTTPSSVSPDRKTVSTPTTAWPNVYRSARGANLHLIHFFGGQFPGF